MYFSPLNKTGGDRQHGGRDRIIGWQRRSGRRGLWSSSRSGVASPSSNSSSSPPTTPDISSRRARPEAPPCDVLHLLGRCCYRVGVIRRPPGGASTGVHLKRSDMVILPFSHSRDENYQEASFVDAITDVDAASLAALARGTLAYCGHRARRSR